MITVAKLTSAPTAADVLQLKPDSDKLVRSTRDGIGDDLHGQLNPQNGAVRLAGLEVAEPLTASCAALLLSTAP